MRGVIEFALLNFPGSVGHLSVPLELIHSLYSRVALRRVCFVSLLACERVRVQVLILFIMYGQVSFS